MSIAPIGRGPAIRRHSLVPRDQGLFPNRLNVRFKQPLHEQTLMEERPLSALCAPESESCAGFPVAG